MTQYISIYNGRRAKGGLTGDLPEDVTGLCAAAQINTGTVAHGEVLRYLEDPNIIRTAREGDIRGDIKPGAPFIKTGSECHPGNISSAEFSSSWQRPPGSIDVGGLHVADCCRHISRGGYRII